MLRWDVEEPEAWPQDDVELQVSPVHHSLGRGCWTDLAERVKLPRVALDSVVQQYGTTDQKAVGGATCISKVGGVRREGGSRVHPKTSARGRGQQLHTAAVRRPGGYRVCIIYVEGTPVIICD